MSGTYETTTVESTATDSIEISKSTKGVYTYSAKIYYIPGQVDEVEERLEAIDLWFEKTYEQPNTGPKKLSDLRKEK